MLCQKERKKGKKLDSFAQVLGGLVLLAAGIFSIVAGFGIAQLMAWNDDSKAKLAGAWVVFIAGIAIGLFIIYLALLALEPVVKFSFINY